MRRGKVWTDRMMTAATAVTVGTVLYFLMTERILPAIRGESVPVQVGQRLERILELEQQVRDASEGFGILRLPLGMPTLVLSFSSTCAACYRNLPAWKRAIESAGSETRVLAVALEPDRESAAAYARRHLGGAQAVWPRDAREFATALGVHVVPHTTLLDANGVVRFQRNGSLDSISVQTLERALGALTGSSNP